MAIRRAIGSVWGAERVPEEAGRFRPHVSAAYLTQDGAATPYISAVSSVEVDSAETIVRDVTLIALNRDNRMYQWTTRAVAPLSQRIGI